MDADSAMPSRTITQLPPYAAKDLLAMEAKSEPEPEPEPELELELEREGRPQFSPPTTILLPLVSQAKPKSPPELSSSQACAPVMPIARLAAVVSTLVLVLVLSSLKSVMVVADLAMRSPMTILPRRCRARGGVLRLMLK